MILAGIILLLLTVPGAWWLSGHDPGLSGENTRRDRIERAALCAVTVVLVESLLFLPKDPAAIPIVLVIAAVLFLIWLRCTGELFAGWFVRLIDPEDKRKFDPNESSRAVDQVAGLLQNGRRDEAVKLVEVLQKSGDANSQVLETMLVRAGIPRAGADPGKPRPLVEAHRLRSAGRWDEAEKVLQTLLAENPANMDAALMLMRLYAQDLKRPGKAAGVLQQLQAQPYIPAAAIEYAARSIDEWSQTKPATVAAAALPESTDELLAGGYFGTAIEILERQAREHPKDFGAWLKLTEAHAVHSGNFSQAEKIVRQMEIRRNFNAEQIHIIKARLAEWRDAANRRKPPGPPQA